MKNIKLNYTKILLLLGLVFITLVGCERELSDDVEFATFSNTSEIFTDTPIGLGSDFYFPFLGSKPTALSFDEDESYLGSASMRIDVPNANDPEGNYAGAIIRVDGAGRNLTEYDALTFWAKASQGVTIRSFGFGQDFLGNKYQVTRSDVNLSTNWVKYIIPIPDASKLLEERGMFWYSAGGIGLEGQEVGYTFWLDELKFEKLGNIAQLKPSILNGQDVDAPTFVGGSVDIKDFMQTVNLGSGINQTTSIAASYFTFHSSNPEVATVDFEQVDNEIKAVVLTHGEGTAVLTASLNGIEANGSLTVEVAASFDFAPTPPARDENSVISIFSNAYPNSNVPASLISNFGQFQTSTLNAFNAAGDDILNYNDVNFFGIEFNGNIPTIDASEMTTLHMDIFVLGELNPGSLLTIQLRNIGPNGFIETNEFTGAPTGDDTQIQTSPALSSGQWISLDFDITGLADRSALGQIVFVAAVPDGPSSFYVDNIYFYK